MKERRILVFDNLEQKSGQIVKHRAKFTVIIQE